MHYCRKVDCATRASITESLLDPMEITYVAVALLSALLHAGWNAAVKSSPQPAQTMTAQMVLAAALGVPGLLWCGMPAPATFIWMACSTLTNMVIITALLKAYELAGFGIVYPVTRALSVMLVVPLAGIIAGETLSPWGLAGVALIASSLLLLGLGNRGEHAIPRAALGWMLLAGVGTAATVMSDVQGIRAAGSPWTYGFAVSISNALAMSWRQRAAFTSKRMILDNAARALPIAVASMTSYMLILWVFSVGPIAPAAALRDTSAVFALVIAIIWLKEPFTRLRLCAILLSAAAVPLLRLA